MYTFTKNAKNYELYIIKNEMILNTRNNTADHSYEFHFLSYSRKITSNVKIRIDIYGMDRERINHLKNKKMR